MRHALGSLIWLLIFSAQLLAAPTLTSLLPAGGQRGSQFTATATGSFPNWPVRCWSSSPEITISPDREKGKLQIAISPQAPAGIHWMRLFDNTGASELRPILVGLYPDVIEVEPNDDAAKGQPVKLPASVHGKLTKSGDVDCFTVRGKRGEQLIASLDANWHLGSPVDAVLQIVSTDYQVLAENHDHRGLDPQLRYTIPRDGDYVVRVFAFPSAPDSSIRHYGSDTSVYRLNLTTGPWVEYVTPLTRQKNQPASLQLHGWNLTTKTVKTLPDRSIEIPNWNTPIEIPERPFPSIDLTQGKPRKPLQPPFSVTGQLSEPIARLTFLGQKAKPLVIDLESASLGFPLNPVVTIDQADGKQLARGEVAKLHSDLTVNFNPPMDGQYELRIRDLGNKPADSFVFRLSCRPANEPRLSASVATDRFTLTKGQPLEIPVSLTKQNISEEIRLEVQGLDPNTKATLAPAKPSKGKTDDKQLIIRLETSTAQFSGPIRIELIPEKSTELRTEATTSLSSFNSISSHFWLTIVSAPAKKK